MEIPEKEYTEHVEKLARNIFVTAIAKGTDNYEQNIRDMVDANVDVLDVVFPKRNNYSAMILAIELREIIGMRLTVNREVTHTNELFELEDPTYEK